MHYIKLFALTYTICGLLCAATTPAGNKPVGKVATAKGLLINGKEMPLKTAPTWPIVVNDRVATTTNSTILMLSEGNRAVVDPNTSLSLIERNGALSLEMGSGKVCLRTVAKTTLSVYASGERLSISNPFEGSITLGSAGQKASVKAGGCEFSKGALLRNKKMMIPLAAGAAAAAGTGSKLSNSSDAADAGVGAITSPSPTKP